MIIFLFFSDFKNVILNSGNAVLKFVGIVRLLNFAVYKLKGFHRHYQLKAWSTNLLSEENAESKNPAMFREGKCL